MNVTHHPLSACPSPTSAPASGPVKQERGHNERQLLLYFSAPVVAAAAGVTRCFQPGVTFNFTHSCVTSRRPACSINLPRRRFAGRGVVEGGAPRRRGKRFCKVTRPNNGLFLIKCFTSQVHLRGFRLWGVKLVSRKRSTPNVCRLRLFNWFSFESTFYLFTCCR